MQMASSTGERLECEGEAVQASILGKCDASGCEAFAWAVIQKDYPKAAICLSGSGPKATEFLPKLLPSYVRKQLGFATVTDEDLSLANLLRYLDMHRSGKFAVIAASAASASQIAKSAKAEETSLPGLPKRRRITVNYHVPGAPIEGTDPERDLGLEIRPSVVPGAGQGLFATRNFKAGDWIAVYFGEELSFTEVQKLSTSVGTDYVLGGFPSLKSVDAKDSTAVARYINHNVTEDTDSRPAQPNCKFAHKSGKTMHAIAVAVRKIEAGEEIYVDYGSGYWKKREGIGNQGTDDPSSRLEGKA